MCTSRTAGQNGRIPFFLFFFSFHVIITFHSYYLLTLCHLSCIMNSVQNKVYRLVCGSVFLSLLCSFHLLGLSRNLSIPQGSQPYICSSLIPCVTHPKARRQKGVWVQPEGGLDPPSTCQRSRQTDSRGGGPQEVNSGNSPTRLSRTTLPPYQHQTVFGCCFFAFEGSKQTKRAKLCEKGRPAKFRFEIDFLHDLHWFQCWGDINSGMAQNGKVKTGQNCAVIGAVPP